MLLGTSHRTSINPVAKEIDSISLLPVIPRKERERLHLGKWQGNVAGWSLGKFGLILPLYLHYLIGSTARARAHENDEVNGESLPLDEFRLLTHRSTLHHATPRLFAFSSRGNSKKIPGEITRLLQQSIVLYATHLALRCGQPRQHFAKFTSNLCRRFRSPRPLPDAYPLTSHFPYESSRVLHTGQGQ